MGSGLGGGASTRSERRGRGARSEAQKRCEFSGDSLRLSLTLFARRRVAFFLSKMKQVLKQHKSAKHEIDVVWYCCTVPGCGFRSKQGVALKVMSGDKEARR